MTSDGERRVLTTGNFKEMPHIVCLCGSTRFMKTFFDVGWQETLKGHIVLSVGCVTTGPTDHAGEFYGVKEMLDELHKRKIDLADEVIVLNVGGIHRRVYKE